MCVITIVLVVLLILIFYIQIRNYYVYRYFNNVAERCYEVCKHHLDSLDTNVPTEEFKKEFEKYSIYYRRMWDEIEKATDYDKLLYSFRPLKDKYWLNEEQLKFINGV